MNLLGLRAIGRAVLAGVVVLGVIGFGVQVISTPPPETIVFFKKSTSTYATSGCVFNGTVSFIYSKSSLLEMRDQDTTLLLDDDVDLVPLGDIRAGMVTGFIPSAPDHACRAAGGFQRTTSLIGWLLGGRASGSASAFSINPHTIL